MPFPLKSSTFKRHHFWQLSWQQCWQQIDLFCEKHIGLWLNLLLLIILRLPNFFEPYWYGDEAIYLTIGQALRAGERLYLEIIDHKTPIIYYLAMVPSQTWFRLLNVMMMLIATTAFYHLSRLLWKRTGAATLVTFLFVILTSLPALEGNIPNGELFVMSWILIGSWFFTETAFFKRFVTGEEAENNAVKTAFAFLLAGLFFGLGLMTKVPGLFDLAAFLSVFWFVFADSGREFLAQFLPRFGRRHSLAATASHSLSKNAQPALQAVGYGLVTFAGILLPVAFFSLYFYLRGSGHAFLDYGLLYNFRYADSWQLSFSSPLLKFLFTLQGKALLLLIWIGLITGLEYLKPSAKFALMWLGLATFAALLSNRPYPHYFLQIVPALCLVLGEMFAMLDKHYRSKLSRTAQLMTPALTAGAMAILLAIFWLLHVSLYPTWSYYTRSLRFVTGQISTTDFRRQFDQLMTDNYRANPIIRSDDIPYLFIWGTNPTLYALTGKLPVGRFTVLFHIRDFHAETETFQDFRAKQPEFAVIMKGEELPTDLNSYLQSQYYPFETFDHFVLWKKLPSLRIAVPSSAPSLPELKLTTPRKVKQTTQTEAGLKK
jgi:hypothetical protein